MAEYGFGAPLREEDLVFGARRPGFPGKFVQRQIVDEWIAYMRKQGISRIVCMMSQDELNYYPSVTGGLLQIYADTFEQDNVLWAPTAEKQLCSEESIKHICYFLYNAATAKQKTVVHGSAGLGRTGQALAAWLAYFHGMSERKALKTLEALNRSPREPVLYGNASEADLLHMLIMARQLNKPPR